MAKDGKRKILRVGIIQSGRIVEERLIRKREDVSIGQAAKNTFILPASHLPKSFTLFESKSGGYQLIFDDTMEGRVSIGEEVLDLKSLGKSGNVRRRGGRCTVELDERSRGKIVVGEFTLLFQFIDTPPVLPKPQLPAAARGANIEWLFVNSLIITGLILGGGGAGLDFWWRNTGQYLQVEFGKKTRAYEMLRAEVLKEKEKEKDKEEPPEDEPEEDENEEAVEETVEVEPETKVKPKRAKPEKTPPKEDSGAAPRKTNRSKGEVLASVKKKTALNFLGSTAGDGPGLANTLAAGLTDGDLDDAYKNTDGGVANADGTRTEFQGGVLAVKTGKGGYKTIGKDAGGTLKTTKTKKTSKADAGKRVKIIGRVKRGSLAGKAGGGQIDRSSVAAVFRRRLGAIKRCYNKALKRNENIRGKLVVRFRIGSAGRITKIKVIKNTTGDAGVATCIKSAMKGWRFPIPEGGPVSFTYPFVLSSSN